MTQISINPRTGKPKYYRGEGKDVSSSAEIQKKRNTNLLLKVTIVDI